MTIRQRPLAALVLLAVMAAGLTGCNSRTRATTPPTPAPVPMPVTALRSPGYTFTLANDPVEHTAVPASYKVTYLSGSVTLRSKPRILIGFRVDPAHPGQQSELLASNVAGAKAKGFATTPVTADGGSGVTFMNTGYGEGGVNQAKSVIARGPVTVTVNVDADPAGGGDAAAEALRAKLVDSLRFHPEGLTGTSWPGAVLAPQAPVTVDVPGELARDSYESSIVTYAVELTYGKYTSSAYVTWQDEAAATSGFAQTKTGLDKAGVHHQPDIKTLPALRDTLGRTVDEGFVFNLTGSDGISRYVGVVFRKAGVTVRLSTNVGDIATKDFDADSTAALTAPMAIGKSWRWTA